MKANSKDVPRLPTADLLELFKIQMCDIQKAVTK